MVMERSMRRGLMRPLGKETQVTREVDKIDKMKCLGVLIGSLKIGLAAHAFNMLEAVTSVGSQKR